MMSDLDDIKKLLEKRNLVLAREEEQEEEERHKPMAIEDCIKVRIEEGAEDGYTLQGHSMILKANKFIGITNAMGKPIAVKDGDAIYLLQGESVDIDTGVAFDIPDSYELLAFLTSDITESKGLVLVKPHVIGKGNVVVTICNVKKDAALIVKGSDLIYVTAVKKESGFNILK